MYHYVFLTWLLANMLHPVTMYLFMNSGNNEPVSIFELLAVWPDIFCLSLLLSIPSLVLGSLMIFLISKMQTDIKTRFLMWLLFVALISVMNFWMIFGWLMQYESFIMLFNLILPSVIAAFSSTLMRINYFFRLFKNTETITQTD